MGEYENDVFDVCAFVMFIDTWKATEDDSTYQLHTHNDRSFEGRIMISAKMVERISPWTKEFFGLTRSHTFPVGRSWLHSSSHLFRRFFFLELLQKGSVFFEVFHINTCGTTMR